ncbi:MAG: hypothetical protein WC184_09835 [Acidimicrobiia bacterium]
MAEDALNPMRSIVSHAAEWMLPYWLERQLNPSSPSFVPALGSGAPENITHRNAVPVGTLGSPEHAIVDPRGLVTPWPGGWSLDWWAGADDRWRLPAREGGVRQVLHGNAPIVETTMRVPGGDFVERVWAFHDSETGPTLAVEFANESKAPLALAIAIRPFGVLGHHRVGTVEVTDSMVSVDGRLAMWLPKPAHRSAAASFVDGDVARVVMTGGASSSASTVSRCEAGFAQAALIYPLSHSASLRVLIPLRSLTPSEVSTAPAVVPPYDAVARGWQSHVGRGTRIVVPDQILGDTFERARTQMLLVSPGVDLAHGDMRDAAAVVRALDLVGLHEEAGLIVETLPEGQGTSGRLGGDDRNRSATGAVVSAFAEHILCCPEWETDDLTLAMAAAGAHYRPGARRWSFKHDSLEIMDAAWHLYGTNVLAQALRDRNEIEAAVEIENRAQDLWEMVEVGLQTGTSGSFGSNPVELLELLAPLNLLEAQSEVASSLMEEIRRRYLHEGAVVDRFGGGVLSPGATARFAQACLRRGEREALESLRVLNEMSTQHLGWPTTINPLTHGGASGEAWSAGAAAAYVEAVCDLMAYTVAPQNGQPAQMVLCPVLPESWLGGNIELHNLNTSLGLLSYGIRWHGKRAALLWDFIPKEGLGEVLITMPGVDPSWSTTELRGDALLGVPPIATELEEVAAEEPAEQEVTLSLGVRTRTTQTETQAEAEVTVSKPIPPSAKSSPSPTTVSFPGLNPEDGQSFS